MRRVSLTGQEFLARYLQHFLPRGFPKVRYYGWLSPSSRVKLAQIRRLLAAPDPVVSQQTTSAGSSTAAGGSCPVCRVGHLVLVAQLPRSRAPP
jgi:hypothetical protein